MENRKNNDQTRQTNNQKKYESQATIENDPPPKRDLMAKTSINTRHALQQNLEKQTKVCIATRHLGMGEVEAEKSVRTEQRSIPRKQELQMLQQHHRKHAASVQLCRNKR